MEIFSETMHFASRNNRPALGNRPHALHHLRVFLQQCQFGTDALGSSQPSNAGYCIFFFSSFCFRSPFLASRRAIICSLSPVKLQRRVRVRTTVLLLSSLYDRNPGVIFLPNVPAMRSDVGGGVGATRQMDVMTATAPRAGGPLASFSNPAP